jgi:steroid 5-alpha reductase family enzyme
MKVFALIALLAIGVILILEAPTSMAFVVAPRLVGSTRSSAPESSRQTWRSQPAQPHPLHRHPIIRGGTEPPTVLQALPTALAALPLSQKILLSCFLPTCLGFWRSEYGVSYAYGMATSLTSYCIYSHFLQSSISSISNKAWAVWHAAALMFYGVRLCLFLLYRELSTERMKQSVKNIEAKAKGRGNRWKRTPFVVSCAGLYFGLCAPLLISSSANVVVTSKFLQWTLEGLVGLTWLGFLLAAAGDLNKSIVKANKGENHLVTGGIFALCRHPNYSGEMLAWTANGLIALVAAASSKGIPVTKLVGYLTASVAGALGLDFVLLSATKGLEKKQKETYGETKEYQRWVDSVWSGFVLPATTEALVSPPVVKPQIELAETEEETGSGI